MITIKIDDTLFSHCKYSTPFQESKYIIWDRSTINGNEDIVVYTDQSLKVINNNVKNKVAWLLESPAVSVQQNDWIKTYYKFFDTIFTSNKDLLDIDDKFKFVPVGGCWIKPDEQCIYSKSKMVSIIASDKNYTDGHQLRTSAARKIKNVDIYGRGFNPIEYKLDGLKDYRFSIVVENTKKDFYYTEKLIDCFMTGTIPIYWGCPSINNFFDDKGMLIFDTLEELQRIVNGVSDELYNLKLEYVRKNFELAKEYLISEDYMYEKYLKYCDNL